MIVKDSWELWLLLVGMVLIECIIEFSWVFMIWFFYDIFILRYYVYYVGDNVILWKYFFFSKY